MEHELVVGDVHIDTRTVKSATVTPRLAAPRRAALGRLNSDDVRAGTIRPTNSGEEVPGGDHTSWMQWMCR